MAEEAEPIAPTEQEQLVVAESDFGTYTHLLAFGPSRLADLHPTAAGRALVRAMLERLAANGLAERRGERWAAAAEIPAQARFASQELAERFRFEAELITAARRPQGRPGD